MKSLILMCLLAQTALAATLQDALKEYGIRVDPANAGTVAKDQHLKGSSKSQHLIEAETAAHEHFEIKIISPIEEQAAQAMIESEQSAIKKLFAPAQTPYLGDVAQAIGGCPIKFGPLEKNVSLLQHESNALLGAASAKKSFGACSKADAKFKAAFAAYYDGASKSVWTWRIFVPWTDSATRLDSDWLNPVLKRFQK